MATEHIMATMERAANERIAAALAILGERFSITFVDPPWERLDNRMRQIRTAERHADELDLIVAATEPKATPKGKPNDSR